jgi:hypothetical protein
MQPDKLKTYFFNTLTIITIISAASVILWQRNITQELNYTIEQLQLNKSSIEKAYLNIYKIQWELEGNQVSENITLINAEKKGISLDSLIAHTDKKIFILGFNWDACQDCVNQEIEYIKHTLNGLYEIVIIISFDSINEYLAYVESNKFELPVYYNNKSVKIITSVSQNLGVHTFLLDNEKRITFPHIANSSFPQLSHIYYQILYEKALR